MDGLNMLRLPSLIAFLTTWSLVAAHTVVTYPGWRGNNLVTNGTTVSGAIPEGSLGINYVDGQPSYPYGMQWQYPCESYSATTLAGRLSKNTNLSL